MVCQMDEFGLIDKFFKTIGSSRSDVVFGIGDDAACLQVPIDKQLLVSSDTLVADVHFLSTWDAYDIAYKAVMVNVSDIAAMGGMPCWMTLALTLPQLNQQWLNRYAMGLNAALQPFNIALIGGDTTHGPLSMTLTIHGLVDKGKAIRRNTAKPGDKIYVSGTLGAAAFAVELMQKHNPMVKNHHQAVCIDKLQHPNARTDLSPYLQRYATAAIDISDGLLADLQHICTASHVGARLDLTHLPHHPLLKQYVPMQKALDFALRGGDDYELCFTIPADVEDVFLKHLTKAAIACYSIGIIESEPGIRGISLTGECVNLDTKGYTHF